MNKIKVVTLSVSRMRLAEALKPLLGEIKKNRLLKSFLSSHPALLEVGLVEILENHLVLFSPYSRDVRDLLYCLNKEKNYIDWLKRIAKLLYRYHFKKSPIITSKVTFFKEKEFPASYKGYDVTELFSKPLGMVEISAYSPTLPAGRLIVRALMEERFSSEENLELFNKLKTFLIEKGQIKEDLTPIASLGSIKKAIFSFLNPFEVAEPKNCDFCGGPVFGRGKYCSDNCRSNFSREKKKIERLIKENPNLGLDKIASKIKHKKVKDKEQFVKKILQELRR